MVKEEITLDGQDRIGTIQRSHQELCKRFHPKRLMVTLQSRTTRGVMSGVGAWTSITLIESSNIKRGNWDKVGVTDGSLTNLY